MSDLSIQNLHVSYGSVNAVRGVSFEVHEGEIVTLIGANGAGKTTMLRAISGLEKAKEGSILYGGADLTKLPAHKIVEQGIVHIPEGRRIFSNLTVYDNLIMGAHLRKDTGEVKADLEDCFDIFPRLKERSGQLGGTLSGGEQQMLAIARGIMTHGKTMLLDEPSMGLAPLVVEEIFEVIKRINRRGTTILLVEQNANIALKNADRAYVLETGTIVKDGSAKDLLHDPSIRAAYLGC
ncbi:ABC transporter ATP-binding protein [Qiania dongpingensis]|uniref:ABC transporter ATP-binding protein n=1 Tax=Qiania dongpingensis TaxID=2763669 RepID=A0A7G9G1A6_9FIRM|nr:ABC transporter ATP-binding protein [Qiania dongpingensis]QNM04588.1 ABC transporter ATP-binding protein [Qiania dongpingensis]